ncbi:MAG: putative porin [Muribaculaceae bacterium]
MTRKSLLFIILCFLLFLPETTQGKKKRLEPSYAWKITPPLGLREPSTIDTLFQNYSLNYIPQGVSYAYAATGNYCAEGHNMLFMQRATMSDFHFRDAVSHWLPSESKMKFYNTRIPMTLLSYNFGGGKQDGQDALGVIFSANANSRLQVGAMLDYLYSKGSYDYQAAKDLTWGLSGSYIGERYEFQGYYFHFNLVAKENGGITDDRYITDPAQVQGGNTSVNAKEIPVNLTDAHNRVKGSELYLNNRYKLGFWKEEQINDTTVKRTLVPVTSIIWTLKYNDGSHRFISRNAEQNLSFWEKTYFNPQLTNDFQNYWQLRNTVGISLLEGFNKYAKAGLAAYITHEARHYNMVTESAEPTEEQLESMTDDPYPDMKTKATEQLLWIGAQLTKQQGRILNYDVTGEIGLVGPAAGEIRVKGGITTRIPLFGDTVPLRAFGHFTNLSAPWLMQHYRSNHFVWENDFGKTRSIRLGGEIAIPWTRTRLNVAVENVQNQLYFNSNGLPSQYGGSAQIFSATLSQNFKFGVFHWDNLVTYQTSSRQDVIPMPQLALNTNMYVIFRIATLHVQLGLDCDYFTRYKGVDFQPATMSFYNQNTVDIGNYPFINAYLNFKLSKTRFYLMMSHVNQGLTGTNYFSMPHYPMNPRRFQLGLSIDFAN